MLYLIASTCYIQKHYVTLQISLHTFSELASVFSSSHLQALRLQISGQKMRRWREINFRAKQFAIKFGCQPCDVLMLKLQINKYFHLRQLAANFCNL